MQPQTVKEKNIKATINFAEYSYLPSMSTFVTEDKGCHRFISTSCLDLENKRNSSLVKRRHK